MLTWRKAETVHRHSSRDQDEGSVPCVPLFKSFPLASVFLEGFVRRTAFRTCVHNKGSCAYSCVSALESCGSSRSHKREMPLKTLEHHIEVTHER